MSETATPSKSKYYHTFYAKCQAQGTHVCPVCFGSYTYFNKSHHNKTAHHQRALAYQQQQQQQPSIAD